jgi:CheY-like chemotaxis protein/anti-sigma regulatory factor (Ser/Thr protein kinase)
MSHEFRSPLNSILALSGLLLGRTDGDLTPEQAQQVGYVRRAAQDLLELVNDLLDLAKVEAGKVEVKPVEFEAVNLFAALRGMLRPLLLNQSVDLIFEPVDRLPRMYTDEGKVSQILRNFISNSLKFTERGEIRVSASLDDEGNIRFSVADTGIGIAPTDLDLIFQDFGQVDHPIQKRVRGTGLGLPLSKKLAALLGGRVLVESELGTGSVFTLQVPQRYREELETVAAPIEWLPDPASVPVLVVEDSPEMMIMYHSYLKGSGFQVMPAGTTREAEDTLDRVRPDAIIMDIVLRSEDTWAFVARLKQDSRTRNIPIVVVSTIDDEAKGFHLGVDRYLLKPIEQSELIKELRSLTGQPAMAQVLIIDDEERDRYLLRQKLRNLPLLVIEAASGTEGIRAACKHRPDVIFLDLGMADLSGFEVLERLKKEPSAAEIPVVVVTSRVLTVPEREVIMRRAVAIVGKGSLEQTDFDEVLRRATNERIPPVIAP